MSGAVRAPPALTAQGSSSSPSRPEAFRCRTATQQYAGTSNNRIPLAQAQPGDLVFFGGPGNFWHVGIYTGNVRMINALNPAVGILELFINQLLDEQAGFEPDS